MSFKRYTFLGIIVSGVVLTFSFRLLIPVIKATGASEDKSIAIWCWVFAMAMVLYSLVFYRSLFSRRPLIHSPRIVYFFNGFFYSWIGFVLDARYRRGFYYKLATGFYYIFVICAILSTLGLTLLAFLPDAQIQAMLAS